MSRAKMYGYYKPYTPNNRADQRKNAFFWKSADSVLPMKKAAENTNKGDKVK